MTTPSPLGPGSLPPGEHPPMAQHPGGAPSGLHRRVAAVVGLVVVGILSGCTVSGAPSAPPAQVAAYRAQQLLERQKANALTTCLTIPLTMRESVDVYNEMIRGFNASGVLDQNLVDKTTGRIDGDIKVLRAASEREVPDDLKVQLGKMISARESQRAAVVSRNVTAMNESARQMNDERDRFTDLCKSYLR